MFHLRNNKLPLLIAAGAFLYRLLTGLELLHTHPGILSPAIVTDMATYQKYAAEILNGKFPSEFYYQPFYYSVFLPLVQLLTGPSAIAVIIAQSFCGAAAVWLTYYTARHIGAGRFGSASAAVLLAFSAMSTVYTPFCLLETLQSFWLVFILYLTLTAMRRRTILSCLWPGLALGCAILTRGNAWLLLPAMLAGLFIAFRKWNWKRKAGAFAVLTAGILIVQIPFAVVNTVARGSLRGPSTAGGNVLALGNTPEAPPGHLVYPRTYNLWMRSEADRSIFSRMMEWMREEPLAFWEQQFLKCLQFWNYREIPNNINPEAAIRMSPILNAAGGGFPTGWIMTAALAGIILSLRRMFRGKYMLLTAVLYILLFCPAVAAFYNLTRFRVPGIPILCVAAALFFHAVYAAWNKKGKEEKRKSFVVILGAAVCGFAIVYPGFDWYLMNVRPYLMRAARPHGVDVPNGMGGRLIYDHTMMLNGGWTAVRVDVLSKQFNPRTPIKPGTPVRLKFPVAGPAYFILNGKIHDLRSIHEGKLAEVKIRTVYPENGVFRFEAGGNAVFLADRLRKYQRTLDREGAPLDGELVIELETR